MIARLGTNIREWFFQSVGDEHSECNRAGRHAGNSIEFNFRFCNFLQVSIDNFFSPIIKDILSNRKLSYYITIREVGFVTYWNIYFMSKE